MATRAKASSHDGLSKPTGTQSIERAALLLREVAAHNRTGLRLVDLAASVRLEKPTVHRILRSLIAENLLLQDPENRRYYLGQALFEYGLAAAHRFSLRDLCEATLRRIADKTEDTVFLTIRSGGDAVCIERKDGAFPIKVFTLNVGDRRPLGVGAGGLAILSALPSEDAKQIVSDISAQLAGYEGLTAKGMLERIKRTQDAGYALNDVSAVSGFRAIGIAVRDAAANPVAAISISAISDRIAGKRKDELVALLKSEALGVEKLLRQPSMARRA